MKLTETGIKTFKPHPSRHRWISDGDGLYLRVMPSGRQSWIWRTKRAGHTSYFTIGEWPAMTVKAARQALAKRTGRATPPNAMTVGDALSEWYDDQIAPRYKVTKNMRTYVERATAEFGARRLQELTRAEIARFVRGYAKAAPVGANRCLSTLKLAMSWCVEMGYLEHSPAAGLTRRIAGGEELTRARVLSDDEIRELWSWEHEAAPLCRFLLCTGLRIQETQRALASHLVNARLKIPAAHAKNGREHWAHVPKLASAQIEPAATPRLFTAIGATKVQAALHHKQRDDVNRWTPHDLRRTFATRLGDLNVGPHIIEKCLNHTAQGVAAIYNRAELADERIAATQLWADELRKIVQKTGPSNEGPKKE
jgi:integrase